MKLYIFYKMKEREDSKTIDVSQVYAITKSKKLKNDFIKTRNMNLFHMKELEGEEREIQKYLKDYGRFRLTTMGFKTSCVVDGFIKEKEVFLTGTMMEEEMVFLNQNKIDSELIHYTNPYAKYLETSYMKALHELHYYEYLMFQDSVITPSFASWYDEELAKEDPFFDGMRHIMDEEKASFEVRYQGVNHDTLAIFIYFFGNTMKVKR